MPRWPNRPSASFATAASQELYNGRAILVRFVISDIKADSVRFEQAFSNDHGKTWEVNWIATDTRIPEPAAAKP